MTNKQIKFAKEYLVDKDPVEAAKRAGYSENYAVKNAKALLEKDEIKKLILKGFDENLQNENESNQQKNIISTNPKEKNATKASILNEVAQIAFGEQRSQDKLKALEMLCKLEKFFNDDSKSKENESIEIHMTKKILKVNKKDEED